MYERKGSFSTVLFDAVVECLSFSGSKIRMIFEYFVFFTRFFYEVGPRSWIADPSCTEMDLDLLQHVTSECFASKAAPRPTISIRHSI